MQIATLLPAVSQIADFTAPSPAAKQLCFDFSSDSEPTQPRSDAPSAKRIRTLTRVPKSRFAGTSKASEGNPAVQPIAETSASAVDAVAVDAVAATHAEARASEVRPVNQRYGGPVRMGAAMFALLKRYGITDQEIQAGVEAYARKYQTAVAS